MATIEAVGGLQVNDSPQLDQNHVAHLELVQGVINRMGSNSFAVKTWTIGLVAALFGLAASTTAKPRLFLAAIVPCVGLWGLDAFYLRHERLFRCLYDDVRKGKLRGDRFSMNTTAYGPSVPFRSAFLSGSVALIYAPLIVLVTLAFALWR